MTRAFLTGSFRYSCPRKDSDIDLVVLVDDETLEVLDEHNEGAERAIPTDAEYGPIRFGKLNIIALTDPEKFEIWRRVSEELALKQVEEGVDIPRDEAVKALQEAGA